MLCLDLGRDENERGHEGIDWHDFLALETN